MSLLKWSVAQASKYYAKRSSRTKLDDDVVDQIYSIGLLGTTVILLTMFGSDKEQCQSKEEKDVNDEKEKVADLVLVEVKVEEVKQVEKKVVQDGQTTLPLNKKLEGTLDIPRFRKLHTDVCEKLTSLCEKWNAKRTLLENLYGDFEEVFGQILAAIGYAQLLISKKLQQYIDLVEQAATQSGDRKVTADDLQGYWDMVCYQVDDLFKRFASLDDLEKNSWVPLTPLPKKPTPQKKSGSCNAKKEVRCEASSVQLRPARKKSMALKQLKMKARQKLKDKARSSEEPVSSHLMPFSDIRGESVAQLAMKTEFNTSSERYKALEECSNRGHSWSGRNQVCSS